MAKRMMIVALASAMMMVSMGGCYKMGKATGNAADQVEESADQFKEGYKDGKSE